MELISMEQFLSLSMEQRTEYLINLINNFSDEKLKELYDHLIEDDTLKKYFKKNL